MRVSFCFCFSFCLFCFCHSVFRCFVCARFCLKITKTITFSQHVICYVVSFAYLIKSINYTVRHGFSWYSSQAMDSLNVKNCWTCTMYICMCYNVCVRVYACMCACTFVIRFTFSESYKEIALKFKSVVVNSRKNMCTTIYLVNR